MNKSPITILAIALAVSTIMIIACEGPAGTAGLPGATGASGTDGLPGPTGATGPDGPLAIDYVNPTYNENNVDTDTDITIVFNRDIETSSLTSPDTFTLENLFSGTTLDVDINVNGNIATIDPATFGLGVEYEYVIAADVMDKSGTTLGYDHHCRFSTGNGSWYAPQLIGIDNIGSANFPVISMNSHGNAFAAWHQDDGTRNNIWSSMYIKGSGWQTAQLIETENTGSAANPKVSMNNQGNAIVVWKQNYGTIYNICSNSFIPGSGWQTAQLIETDNTGDAAGPQVVMDTQGNAIAVWHQHDGSRNNIWSNRYVAGTGWQTAQLIETDNTGNAYSPQVAIDSHGNAIAVWYQHDGSRNNIWSNRYVAGTGWQTAQLIETNNAGYASSPRIAVDDHDDAIVVWFMGDGARFNIWANRYVAGTGWQTAQLIETDNAGNAFNPDIAIDSRGNALAVWHQDDGTRNNICSNRFIPGSGWQNAQLIENDNTGLAYDARIAMDSRGNAVAVWSSDNGTLINTWSNNFIADSGWQTAQLIENDNAFSTYVPQIAMNSLGSAIAVWNFTEGGTRYNIMSRNFK